jgi:DNA-binding NarL/FixJ family response regulator
LEAGYSLDGDDGAWLAGLLDCVAREHWPQLDLTAHTFDFNVLGRNVRDVRVHGRPELRDYILGTTNQISADGIGRTFRSGVVVGTLSEIVLRHNPKDAATFREVTAGTAADLLGVVAHSGTGLGVVLSAVLDKPRHSTPTERRRWTRCAAHLGAGLRLRAMTSQLATLDAKPVEAIFDSGGKLHDARAAATSRTAREVLRRAVLDVDKARSATGRRESDAALDRWEGLVRGRWSLIDRFDSDRRRFVVAVRNDPQFTDPRGLSLRERQVAEYVGLGRSAKEIAYLLGAPAASIENSTRRAQAKLGFSSRVELAEFFSPHGIRAGLAQVALADDTLIFGATERLGDAKFSGLTEAEQAVLGLLVAGSTNRDIARRRSTSPNTAANQIQSIFRKFGVRSRIELIARLTGSVVGSVGN